MLYVWRSSNWPFAHFLMLNIWSAQCTWLMFLPLHLTPTPLILFPNRMPCTDPAWPRATRNSASWSWLRGQRSATSSRLPCGTTHWPESQSVLQRVLRCERRMRNICMRTFLWWYWDQRSSCKSCGMISGTWGPHYSRAWCWVRKQGQWAYLSDNRTKPKTVRSGEQEASEGTRDKRPASG